MGVSGPKLSYSSPSFRSTGFLGVLTSLRSKGCSIALPSSSSFSSSSFSSFLFCFVSFSFPFFTEPSLDFGTAAFGAAAFGMVALPPGFVRVMRPAAFSLHLIHLEWGGHDVDVHYVPLVILDNS
jgi:hypothetical protein